MLVGGNGSPHFVSGERHNLKLASSELSVRLFGNKLISSAIFLFVFWGAVAASAASRHTPIALGPDDVLATGNQWISLPDINAGDGSLRTFNVLSMRHRGLLQVSGQHGGPVLQPYLTANGKPLDLRDPSWELIEYWIPSAHLTIAGLEATLTYCAPPDSRAAFLRMTLANRRTEPVEVTLGLKATFGSIDRVTYVPVELRGERTVATAPWVDPAEVFSYITEDTDFAWTLLHPGSKATITMPPPL